MAVYRMQASQIRRSAGQSACAAAAYRSGCEIEDQRYGKTHDYTRKGGVAHSEIVAPDNAPDWTQDRAALWNAVEAREKRKDAQLATDLTLSLPHELDDAQRQQLVREYVLEEHVRKRGIVADIAIHRAHREGDDRNHHAHVMMTLRRIDADGWAAKKERTFNAGKDKDKLMAERIAWCEYQNRALEKAGLDVRVDHRSLADRGIDQEPEPKLGPMASKMEREGRKSHAGDDLRAVRERNQERAQLEQDRKIIDLEIERERRKLETAFREARVQDDYAKGVVPQAANDDQLAPQNKREPERRATTAADGYARGDPGPQHTPEPDPAADLRAAQEAALRERVTGLESQIEGRGRASILWGKITGRVPWDAEQQLETQRAELATMEQARVRDEQQRQAVREQQAQPEWDQGPSQPEPEHALRSVPPERQEPELPLVQTHLPLHAASSEPMPSSQKVEDAHLTIPQFWLID